MSSETFHTRFEAGELGDEIDLIRWATAYEIHQESKAELEQMVQVLPPDQRFLGQSGRPAIVLEIAQAQQKERGAAGHLVRAYHAAVGDGLHCAIGMKSQVKQVLGQTLDQRMIENHIGSTPGLKSIRLPTCVALTEALPGSGSVG